MGFVQVKLLIYLEGEKKILCRTSYNGETIAHYENAELAI